MKVIKINDVNEALRIKKRHKDLEEDSGGMLKFHMVYTVDGIKSEQTVSAVNAQKATELIKKQYEGKNVNFILKQQVNENLNEVYGYKVSYDELIEIQGKIDRLLRAMADSHQGEISPSSNTYGIGLPFIGTSEGYIDLQNISQYIEDEDFDDEDYYYESLNEEKIADKIRANQDPKEMTKRAIKMLKDLGGEYKDLAKEYEDAYGEDPLEESLKEDLSEETPSTPETEEATGLSNIIITAINDEWKTIAYYNDLVELLRKEGKDEMINVIEDIANEENKHVGQLQEIMKQLSPNTSSIADGETEGSEQLNQFLDNTSQEASNFSFKINSEGDFDSYAHDDDFGNNSGFDIYLI